MRENQEPTEEEVVPALEPEPPSGQPPQFTDEEIDEMLKPLVRRYPRIEG